MCLSAGWGARRGRETRAELRRGPDGAPPRPEPAPAHLDLHVLVVALGVQVEVHDFGAQPRLHLAVHLVAGVHERPGQLHVVGGQAVVGAQSQRPWQEAHQVVLKSERVLTTAESVAAGGGGRQHGVGRRLGSPASPRVNEPERGRLRVRSGKRLNYRPSTWGST